MPVSPALALWAWTSGLWPVALVLAIAIDAARLQPLRAPLSVQALRRIALAVRIAVVAAVAFLASVGPLPQAILGALVWGPILLLPLILAQRLGEHDRIPLEALRRGAAGARALDLRGAYVLVTLLAAAAAVQTPPYFYLALVAIGALALQQRRSARAIALFALAAMLGHFAHTGLFKLQQTLETSTDALLAEWLAERTRNDRSRTRIGDLGRVKLSGRVLMRVTLAPDVATPLLLRDASYSIYEAGTWRVASAHSAPFVSDERRGEPAATISMRLRAGEPTPLALPLATTRIEGVPADTLAVNSRGAISTGAAQAFADVSLWRGDADDPPPEASDLAVPASLAPVLDRVLAEIGLQAQATPQARRAAIERFFAAHFRYTLALGEGRSLAEFLTGERVGHCEYFAAATVLLLRRAGIAARYATGYSVEEWSEREQRYVVRARHGHAWTLAHLDGRWSEIDTTPSTWASADERETRAFWEPIVDLWQAMTDRFARWRARGGSMLAVIALVAVVLAAIVFRRRLAGWMRRAPSRPLRAAIDPHPLAPIEAHFAALARPRPVSMGWIRWCNGLHAEGLIDEAQHRALVAIVRDHYRSTFGPAASTSSPGSVDAAVHAWLQGV